MPAVPYGFGDAIGSDGTTTSYNGTTGTLTTLASDPDGNINVGDEVTITGFDAASLAAGGVSDGTAFYLGDGVFNGHVGYVFGDASTIGANTAFFVVFDDIIFNSGTLNAVRDYANDTSSQTLGSALACFAAGTLIATDTGETAVEALKIGDTILTETGSLAAVKWVGRQTVHQLFSGPHAQPVRIRAGALGGGLPHSDLTVTADHGMLVDGLVINASALVNHDTIDFVPVSELPGKVTYYHVETENHDVIFANGAPAETFIDYAGRQAFTNYQEYVDLYGAERIIPEMDRPRISTWRMLPDAIKQRLAIIEEDIDWAAPLYA
ncbi:MAG: Hint domain-containing protein [Rhodobacter sp.]|nr:Hint domain-containing protein [Rhodobacter sp.]